MSGAPGIRLGIDLGGTKIEIAALDGQALMHAAHALKSSSMSLGATVFSTHCATLEQLGRATTLDDAPALLARAETEFAAVCSAFRQALEEDAP